MDVTVGEGARHPGRDTKYIKESRARAASDETREGAEMRQEEEGGEVNETSGTSREAGRKERQKPPEGTIETTAVTAEEGKA